jgi:hypothetical protein
MTTTSLTDATGPLGLSLSRCDGHLVIAGVSLRGPAWWVTDLEPAWRYGDRRGANKVIPYVPGDRPYRHRRAGTLFTFQVVFGGLMTPSGAPASVSQVKQLYANFAALRAAIVDDPGTPTVSSTLTTPDEVDHAAAVQVLDMPPGRWSSGRSGNAFLLASLSVLVPAGGWV